MASVIPDDQTQLPANQALRFTAGVLSTSTDTANESHASDNSQEPNDRERKDEPDGDGITDVDKKLIIALRAFVGTKEVKRDDVGKVGWLTLVFMIMIVIDVSTYYVLLSHLSKHPLVVAGEKVLPIIFGTTFVAFFQDVRAASARFGRSWLAWITVLALALPASLVVMPYKVPVSVRADENLSLDNAPFERPNTDKKGIGSMTLHGFVTHQILVQHFDVASKTMMPSHFVIDRRELLRTRFGSQTPLVLRSLVPVTITHVTGAMKLAMQGELPDPYVNKLKEGNTGIVTSNGAQIQVVLPLKAHLLQEDLELPEGNPLALRVLLNNQCWSKSLTFTPQRNADNVFNMTTAECDPSARIQ